MTELMQEQTGAFEQADIDNNKTMAGLAYIIFFLPLLVCPQSKYARFHANQGAAAVHCGNCGQYHLGHHPDHRLDLNAYLCSGHLYPGHYGPHQRFYRQSQTVADLRQI